jgi:hypothetical protein
VYWFNTLEFFQTNLVLKYKLMTDENDSYYITACMCGASLLQICFSFWQTHLRTFSQLWNAWIPVILTTLDNERILSNFDRWQKKSQRENNTLRHHHIHTINGMHIHFHLFQLCCCIWYEIRIGIWILWDVMLHCWVNSSWCVGRNQLP